MDLREAQTLALSLMREHGLTPRWSFQYDNAVRRFGRCQYSYRLISLSRELTYRNGEAEVRDVILHEIAHALAGHAAGHGPVWKAKARAIGARPERCYDSKMVNKPPTPYVAHCWNCRKEYGRHRLTKTPSACSPCCKLYNGGRFTTRFVLTFKRRQMAA